jgi:beta-glucosidase
MPKMRSLKPLLLLAAGFLAAPACTLDPPKYTLIDGGAGNNCPAAGGNTGSIDGGNSDPGTFVTVTPVQCSASNAALGLKYTEGYKPKSEDLTKVETLLSQMSLADKATQMRGMPYGSSGKAQMNDTQRSKDTKTIRGYHYRDASRGVNFAEDMNGTKPSAGKWYGTKVGYSTTFPASMARGAAFDLDLEYAIGEAIGDEMMAAKETLLLAPCMNILRHPLWGRAQETYGEDAFHLGRMASAMTVGIQQHITANAKHYLAYDIEFGRDFNNMTLDEQTLRETYGRHFRMVVQDGGVASVMASYNMVNGIKAIENGHILTDVLRTDFGFQGFVLSDWWAMNPQTNVGTDTTTLMRYAISAVNAGLDVELPWSFNYGLLESIVQNKGGLTEGQITMGARRVLQQKVRFNSYDIKKDTFGLGAPKTTYQGGKIVYGCNDGHVDLARKAAVESMVLLKNENKALPIPSSVKKVAVLGVKDLPYKTKNDGQVTDSFISFATDVHTGDMGSSRVFSDPTLMVSPFDGIKKMAPEGVTVVTGSSAADAADADFVVVIAGLTAADEGEEYTLAGDRDNFALDAKQTDPKFQGIQNNLITSVAALGKPMVVVLEGGSIIDMPWLGQVPAVVMAWYAGMVGGEAMGQLLWGQANFSGKLPFTWGQLSDFPAFKGATGTTDTDYYLGYRYFDKHGMTPTFPFGYGLSYTTFDYSNLQLGCSDMSEGAVLPVYVEVENTGSVAGDEVVMLFVGFPNSKAARRTTIKELKGFTRVSLAAHEKKQVMIPVRLKDLDYYDQEKGKWVVEDGAINIMVGGRSTSLTQVGTVNVRGYTKDSSNY